MPRKKKETHHVDDLRKLSDGDMAKELNEAYRQLFTLRLQLITRQQTNSGALPRTRRRIARIRTLQRERQLAAARAAAGQGE